MGLTTLSVGVANPKNGRRSERVKCIVDTGATYSVIQASTLGKLGIQPDDEVTLSLADGREILRKVGVAQFVVGGKSRPSTVIIGQAGDVNLLGVVTLEVMGLFLDPLRRELLPLKIMIAGSRS